MPTTTEPQLIIEGVRALVRRRLSHHRAVQAHHTAAAHACTHGDDLATYGARAKAAFAVVQELEDLLEELETETPPGEPDPAVEWASLRKI